MTIASAEMMSSSVEKRTFRPASLPTFALFLFPLLVFNKGFTYIRIWVGGIPIFITEIALGALALVYAGYCVRKKRLLFPADQTFLLFMGLLALTDAVALA